MARERGALRPPGGAVHMRWRPASAALPPTRRSTCCSRCARRSAGSPCAGAR